MNNDEFLNDIQETKQREIARLQDRIIREVECKKLTGLSRTTRWRGEKDGWFPKRRQLSPNSIGWYESEVKKWIESREVAA